MKDLEGDVSTSLDMTAEELERTAEELERAAEAAL
jgi:hypothetical protein